MAAMVRKSLALTFAHPVTLHQFVKAIVGCVEHVTVAAADNASIEKPVPIQSLPAGCPGQARRIGDPMIEL